VTHKLVDLMSERSFHFLHRMETLARGGLIPRLATLLLEKAENGVVAGTTHEVLAEHLGLHRESITATLGELRRAGIITFPQQGVSLGTRSQLCKASRNSALGN